MSLNRLFPFEKDWKFDQGRIPPISLEALSVPKSNQISRPIKFVGSHQIWPTKEGVSSNTEDVDRINPTRTSTKHIGETCTFLGVVPGPRRSPEVQSQVRRTEHTASAPLVTASLARLKSTFQHLGILSLPVRCKAASIDASRGGLIGGSVESYCLSLFMAKRQILQRGNQ